MLLGKEGNHEVTAYPINHEVTAYPINHEVTAYPK